MVVVNKNLDMDTKILNDGHKMSIPLKFYFALLDLNNAELCLRDKLYKEAREYASASILNCHDVLDSVRGDFQLKYKFAVNTVFIESCRMQGEDITPYKHLLYDINKP